MKYARPRINLLALAALLIVSAGFVTTARPATAAAPPPELDATILQGGAGEQLGHGIAVSGPALYVSGYSYFTPPSSGILTRYDLPLAAPAWDKLVGQNIYYGLAASTDGVYPVGGAMAPACGAVDGAGSEEPKGMLARYTLAGDFDTCSSPGFFQYRGGEHWFAATTGNEGGTPVVYTAGGGETCGFGNASFALGKYDAAGNRLSHVVEPGWSYSAYTCAGTSNMEGIVAAGGQIYLAGFSNLSGLGEDSVERPVLMAYSTALARQWRRRSADLAGRFYGVAAADGWLYAVGYTNTPGNTGSENYLVQKYSLAGVFQWSRSYGGADVDVLNDVVAVGGRIFAAGYTRSEGAGGDDAVLLEIDPADGDILAQRLFGGAQDDRANGITSDGSKLYLVGEARSFATPAGNAVGQSDLLILSYTLPPEPTYSVSGAVRTAGGTPLAGVTVAAGGGVSAVTGADGSYTLSGLAAGAYTLSASKAGYSFAPGTLAVSLPPSGAGQDFTGTPDPVGPAWTFMLYLAGDNDLGPYMERVLRAMEAQPANPQVNLVVQIDGLGRADTRRMLVQPGGRYTPGLNRWELGELNMGDPVALGDFVTWARERYPAQHYYLAIADHGLGLNGTAWDDASADHLTSAELHTGLSLATGDGARPIDVLHYDSCLMAMLEQAYQVHGYADYLLAMENLGWSVFAYDRYAKEAGAIGAVPAVAATIGADTSARDLATALVGAYFSHPLLQGQPRTISALDLSYAAATRQALDDLAAALRASLATHKILIWNTRLSAQKFDSRDFYRLTSDDEYVDLYDLALRLKANIPEPQVQAAAQAVLDVVAGGLVVAERHQSGYALVQAGESYWNLDGARGVSIYFPPQPGSRVYNDYLGNQLVRFTADSAWDELLNDFFAVMGLPPDPLSPVQPAPMLPPPTRTYIPLIGVTH